MPINPLPKGTQPLVPYLMVEDANKAITFYQEVFAAQEIMRLPGQDGKTMHAEIQVAGCMLYLSDMSCENNKKKSSKDEKMTMGLTLYCLDADKVFERALKAGAKSVKAMEDAFWGDRCGTFRDPFGHNWTVMTRKEELTVNEVLDRAKQFAHN